MDRFDAMQAFVRVVETGSFTKAAETLRISKTSVTQQVQQLEARLRVRLLNRTTRRVNVTADGAAFTNGRCACWRIWTTPRPACPPLRRCRGDACASTCPARWHA